MTTGDVIALGFGGASLIMSTAALILKAAEAEKQIRRIVGTLAAVAITAAAGTFGYVTVSKHLEAKPVPNCESALLGSWSGTYKTNGVNFGLGMSITSIGGNRLKAYMSFSMGPLDGSETMTGTCSGTSVNLSSPDGDLAGSPPAKPRDAFSGVIDFGFSVNFTVNR